MRDNCQIFLDTAPADSDLVTPVQTIETYEPYYRPQIEAFRYEWPLTEEQRIWLGDNLIDEASPGASSVGFFRIYSDNNDCPPEDGSTIIWVREGQWVTRYPVMKNLKAHDDADFHKQFARKESKGRPIVARELQWQSEGVTTNKPVPPLDLPDINPNL